MEESCPLIPTFARKLWCFSPSESLLTALEYMRTEDFSQIVVLRDGTLCLLTVEGITRWLAGHVVEETVQLGGVTVGDVLPYELPNDFLVMAADGTVGDAREAFAKALEEGRPRIYAIIVTRTGKATEMALGIVTPWDVMG
jgi:predicted transcriptional regulator